MRATILLSVALIGLVVACEPHRDAPADARDIVLITVDTLRADRLGVYGWAAARTPTIDALAARGRMFTQATTPFPRTTPALASLMTGLWPQRHGSREVGRGMNGVETLAEWLSQRGYRTLGFTANRLAGEDQGFARGFAEFWEPESLDETVAAAVTDRVLGSLDDDGRPLFLWVHYLDPHFPYLPPAQWAGRESGPLCRELGRRALEDWSVMGAIQANVEGLAGAALEDCSALYDAEVAYVDAEIARLLAGLERRGELAEAYVVLTSDHGENLGEEGLYYEHGPSLHDASLRVPLIVAGPGIEAGVDDQLARLEDLAPTLLALLGVGRDELPATDGVDFAARLRGGSEASGGVLAVAEGGSALHPQTSTFLRSGRVGSRSCVNAEQFSLCGEEGGTRALFDRLADPWLTRDVSARHPETRRRLEEAAERWGVETARQRAVRSGRFKLVERPALEGGYRRALYELSSEEAERRDVTEAFPDVAAELGGRLDAWTATLPPLRVEERSIGLLERLRSLGYVQ